MSDSVRPHRRQPTRLPHPWDSPGKNTGVGCHFLLQCMKVKSEGEVTQLYLTLSNPMDCSLPSSIHGIFQVRVFGSKQKNSNGIAGTIVLVKVLYCRIKDVFFIFVLVYFVCIICVKSITNLSQYSSI